VLIKLALVLGVVVLTLVVIIIVNARPRLKAGTLSTVSLPKDLDEYLAKSESNIQGIRKGNQKGIVWNSPTHVTTPLSIVYIHGFSASRGEVSPVMETIAKSLGANLFFTRLSGHGQDSAALALATVPEWIADTSEAVGIGERIGSRVILAGMSTGATLALWAAMQRPNLAALILMSPNFGLKDTRAGLLSWPGALPILKRLLGPKRSWEPKNDLQKQFWTYSYPLEALLPMMDVVELVNRLDLSQLKVPTLTFLSTNDETVNIDQIREKFKVIGTSRKDLIEISDAAGHVLTGDAVSPATNQKVESQIVDFVKSLH